MSSVAVIADTDGASGRPFTNPGAASRPRNTSITMQVSRSIKSPRKRTQIAAGRSANLTAQVLESRTILPHPRDRARRFPPVDILTLHSVDQKIDALPDQIGLLLPCARSDGFQRSLLVLAQKTWIFCMTIPPSFQTTYILYMSIWNGAAIEKQAGLSPRRSA
jgi:hypothetical protein